MDHTAPSPLVGAATLNETAGGHRVASLDGWRGLAILLVLQAHFLPLVGFDSGQTGVSIFFSLSGMLMSEILFVRRVPLATFYKRRVSRILPAFVFFVCTVFGVAAWLRGTGSTVEFLSTLFFMRTYYPAVPDTWHTGLPIGHLWSLNVEEHCYVFLSVITVFAILRGREAWVLAVATLASIVLYYVYLKSASMAGQSFEIRTEVAASFLLASAGYLLVRDRVKPYVKSWMPIAAIAIAVGGFVSGARWWVSALLAPLALAFAVNHLQQMPRLCRRGLEGRALCRIGVWSYSIYLWQQPFYIYATSLPPGVPLAGGVLLGLASFYLLENPTREWLNKHW